MTDILYVSANRLEMSKESFTALIENTSWSEVRTLFIADDGSTDGTREWLEEQMEQLADYNTPVVINEAPFGGPVAAMNWYLRQTHEAYVDGETDRFAKVDNDFVVCPGWIDELLLQATLHPDVDLFGIEPMLGPPIMPPAKKRHLREARWIGGKGLMRIRAFDTCWPRPTGKNGYFGFTEFQSKHGFIKKAWVEPDLPCFGLDQLPFEPWISLTAEYVERGWQRAWNTYDTRATEYWDWWLKRKVEA
jgi:glycosyltransferase involved in cell wall biosynthesis